MVMSDGNERIIKLREQLKEIESAISAIISGAQEYRIGTRSLRRADLTILYRERDRLEKEIEAEESGNGIFHVAIFDRR